MFLPINNISYSTINGPDYRLVIWVQGCPLRCPGCFNPTTHKFDKKSEIDVDEIVNKINKEEQIKGITISGGEPLAYPEAIFSLLSGINNNLTRILYSGFTLKEILADKRKSKILKLVDLAIVGRYNKDLEHPYLGKVFLNVTGKIDANYFSPKFKVEYSISDRNVTKTGIFK